MLKCWRRWNNSAKDCMRFIAAKIKCNFVVRLRWKCMERFNWESRRKKEWVQTPTEELTLNYIKSLHKMFQSLKINLSLFVAVELRMMKFFQMICRKLWKRGGRLWRIFKQYLACRSMCAYIYHNKLRFVNRLSPVVFDFYCEKKVSQFL